MNEGILPKHLEIVPVEKQSPDVVVDPETQVAIYEAAENMMKDLQLALALLQKYQRNLSMLGAPDPEIVAARDLLRRHEMTYEGTAQLFRIFAGGVDITEHPDSIPGTLADDVEEIEDAEVIELEQPDSEG